MRITNHLPTHSTQLEVNKPSSNYLVNFREFIAEFLKISTEISEIDRQKTNDLKRQYLEATKESAGAIQSKGLYDLAFAVGSVGVYTLRVFTNSDIDKGMIDLITRDGLPGIKNLAVSRVDAHARKVDANQMLLGNEHQAKVTKSASDSGKQEFIAALREAFQNSVVRG